MFVCVRVCVCVCVWVQINPINIDFFIEQVCLYIYQIFFKMKRKIENRNNKESIFSPCIYSRFLMLLLLLHQLNVFTPDFIATKKRIIPSKSWKDRKFFRRFICYFIYAHLSRSSFTNHWSQTCLINPIILLWYLYSYSQM